MRINDVCLGNSDWFWCGRGVSIAFCTRSNLTTQPMVVEIVLADELDGHEIILWEPSARIKARRGWREAEGNHHQAERYCSWKSWGSGSSSISSD